MSVPFYAKSPENQGYIKNMEVVGFCDLNGVNAFQMALHKTDDGRYYMYCGSFRGPGWNVVDVTDPTQPKVVNWLEACDPKEYPRHQHPPKIPGGRRPDDRRHRRRRLLPPRLQARRQEPGQPADLRHQDRSRPPQAAGQVGDRRRRTAWACTASLQRRRYVHLSADCRATPATSTASWTSSSPTHPVEVGRWWVPCQFTDGLKEGEYPVDGPQHWEFMDWPQLHGPPFVVGNLAYLSYYCEGLIILDISDITRPKKIGQLQLKGPFSGKFAGARTHTCLPCPAAASWWPPTRASASPSTTRRFSPPAPARAPSP